MSMQTANAVGCINVTPTYVSERKMSANSLFEVSMVATKATTETLAPNIPADLRPHFSPNLRTSGIT